MNLESSKKRHIYKTITWRIVGTVDTMVLAWLITGNPMTGFKIGLAEIITKMTLYYFHERAWYKISLGIDKPRTIHTELNWEPNSTNIHKQVTFLQSETNKIRKRVKVTCNLDHTEYRAILSSYNLETKERLSDIIIGTKDELESKLNIKI